MTGSLAKDRKLVFSITEEEVLRLQQILIDEDAAEALRFLKEHGRKALREYSSGGCRKYIVPPHD